MSQLNIDVLRAKTAGVQTPAIYPVRGSGKVWANLNGTGTIALRNGLNIASVTDNGTGSYTFNFVASFGDTGYGTTMAWAQPASNSDICRMGTSLVGSQAMEFVNPGGTIDTPRLCIEIVGDLA